MLARTTVLSASSTAVVILVSAGVSAAFELNQVRTTHYGWLNNSCGSGNAMPGDCISTKGQTESFRANISSDGSFEHPTTLAVSAQCLQGRRVCPSSGYLRLGDLVFVPDLGWFRVEDTCGACEAGQTNAGAIALWTATASGTGIQLSQLDQRRPTIQVFHPEQPIPDALKRLKANPEVWQPLVWTDPRHMTGANATSLFVDRQLKRIPASAAARSATPAKTTARPRDATRPTERAGTLTGPLPELPDPLAERGRSEPTRPQAGARRAGTVLAVDPQERTLTVDEFGANAERRALRVQVPRDALVLVSKRNQSARDLKDAFRETSISLADIREGDFVVVELSADPEVARLVMVTVQRRAGP